MVIHLAFLSSLFLFGNQGESTGDQQTLLQQEERQAQLMAQQEVIDTDVALLQEREQRIVQLEVLHPLL